MIQFSNVPTLDCLVSLLPTLSPFIPPGKNRSLKFASCMDRASRHQHDTDLEVNKEKRIEKRKLGK